MLFLSMLSLCTGNLIVAVLFPPLSKGNAFYVSNPEDCHQVSLDYKEMNTVIVNVLSFEIKFQMVCVPDQTAFHSCTF